MGATLTQSGRGTTVIQNLLCPDGKRRTFNVHSPNMVDGIHYKGFVSVYYHGVIVSVTGLAKKKGRGYVFVPHANSKNADVFAN